MNNVEELTLLYEISQVLMSTIKLDELLHLFLTAITIREGLGFNRAMLFLIDEEANILKGVDAVGPDSYEEAARIWAEITKEKKKLIEWAEWILNNKQNRTSNICNVVKSINVSFDEDTNLVRAINEKKYFLIKNMDDKFLNEHIFSKIGMPYEYVITPIISRGEPLGVILVDNFFNKRQITEKDIQLLTTVANHAGIAIENSKLYHELEITLNELKYAQDRIIRMQRLAAIGELSAKIAHEIRTPLVSIGGFARRLLKEVENSNQKKYCEIIVSEISRLEDILTNILKLSREPSSEYSSNSILQIIDDVLLMFEDEFNKNKIKVVKKFSNDIPNIYCEPSQMKEVFINLFSNARDAMPNGGELTIDIKSLFPHQESIMIEISDTGGGIPDDILSQIFNPFFTTKEKGTGLGLAIVKKIINEHGGDIIAKNNGRGGSFIITLPAPL